MLRIGRVGEGRRLDGDARKHLHDLLKHHGLALGDDHAAQLVHDEHVLLRGHLAEPLDEELQDVVGRLGGVLQGDGHVTQHHDDIEGNQAGFGFLLLDREQPVGHVGDQGWDAVRIETVGGLEGDREVFDRCVAQRFERLVGGLGETLAVVDLLIERLEVGSLN